MQHPDFSRPQPSRPIAIEVDGQPLGVVVPSGAGYRFLAVRLPAFVLDGAMFDSVEDAESALGAAIHDEPRP